MTKLRIDFQLSCVDKVVNLLCGMVLDEHDVCEEKRSGRRACYSQAENTAGIQRLIIFMCPVVYIID